MSSQSLAARFRIGIDTGGTFTDIVSVDTLSGKTHVTKVASTPANPAIGLLRGVNEILAAAGATTDDVAGLAHGTTVATNALLQGEINPSGFTSTPCSRPTPETPGNRCRRAMEIPISGSSPTALFPC